MPSRWTNVLTGTTTKNILRDDREQTVIGRSTLVFSNCVFALPFKEESLSIECGVVRVTVYGAGSRALVGRTIPHITVTCAARKKNELSMFIQ